MEKQFLATCAIFPNTTEIRNPPISDSVFIVPNSSADAEGFELITVRKDGKIERQNDCECDFSAFPLMYISSTQCGASGDMELESPISLESSRGIFSVTRTRPFPGKDESSVVLFSGSIKNCSGSMTLGTLPEGFHPATVRAFVCSLEGDYVEIMRNGDVVLHAVGGADRIFLDNIRFVAGESNCNCIRARLPYRSSINNLSVGIKEEFGPISSDFLIPVSVRIEKKSPSLSVVALTQSGDVIPLWDDIHSVLSSDLLVSSLLLAPSNESGYSPIDLLTMSEKDREKLDRLVAAKISALTFSELSGEDPLRCIRRDRTWRQTGIKTKPVRETIF